MKFLVVILLLVALANARPRMGSPSPCESPKQFVGNYGVYSTARNTSSAQNGKMYYDGNGERIRVDVVIKGVPYRVVQEYKEKLQYVMFNHSGHELCVVQPWTAPFHPIEIPAYAGELEHGRIGTAAHGLDIRRFYGITKEGAQFLATVTADDCVVTSSVARVPTKGITFFSLTDVSRLQTTDADFEHPSASECKPTETYGDSSTFGMF